MPRVRQSKVRCPIRSPATPKKGENSDPSHARAATMTSCCTEPVAASTYQPRISASISKAHDVARSAGHWKRKLRTAKGDAIAECYRRAQRPCVRESHANDG